MNTPLSIAIVCFPSIGGSGVVASELAIGLAERGHRVHLLASAMPSRLPWGMPGLTFHPVRVPDYPIFEHPPYDLAVATRLVDIARAERLDVVNVHYAVPHAASAWLAKLTLGAGGPRVVASLHGTDVTRVGADPAYRAVTCAAITAADGVVVPSDHLRRQAYAQLGIPEHVDIEVLPNFVDTDRFSPTERRDRARLAALFPDAAPGDPMLIHVSNFRPVKRVVDLFEVLSRVRQTLPAKLVVVGDGPDREKAEQRVHELGLVDDVRFLGRRADFVADLRHADAFLLPSEMESFGVAALEALSTGVPVFAYRVGGLPEVVTPEVGRLVEPYDLGALADAVVAVLMAPALRERMSKAARARVLERFRRAPALDRYETFFRRIVAGGRAEGTA